MTTNTHRISPTGGKRRGPGVFGLHSPLHPHVCYFLEDSLRLRQQRGPRHVVRTTLFYCLLCVQRFLSLLYSLLRQSDARRNFNARMS